MDRMFRACATAAAVVWAATAGGAVLAQAQSTATLEVVVQGFKGKEGQALLTVYGDKATWLQIPKAVKTQKRPITGKTLRFKVEGLKPGAYGVSVLHDANANNELDMRWFPFPKPKEGAGASRDPKAKMGPPKWEDAQIEVKAGERKKLVIHLKYL